MICSSLSQVHQCTTLLMKILYMSLQRLTELKNTLRFESEVIINWSKNNKMIVNPEKSQATIFDKQKHDYSNETFEFDNKTVKTVSSVSTNS